MIRLHISRGIALFVGQPAMLTRLPPAEKDRKVPYEPKFLHIHTHEISFWTPEHVGVTLCVAHTTLCDPKDRPEPNCFAFGRLFFGLQLPSVCS